MRYLPWVAVAGLLSACLPADFDGLEPPSQPVERSGSPSRDRDHSQGAPAGSSPATSGSGGASGEGETTEEEATSPADEGRPGSQEDADLPLPGLGDGEAPDPPAADGQEDAGVAPGMSCEDGADCSEAPEPECEDGNSSCGGCQQPCPAPQFGVGRCTLQGCEQVVVATGAQDQAELIGQVDGGAVIDPLLQCADGEVMVGVHGRFAGILYGIGIVCRRVALGLDAEGRWQLQLSRKVVLEPFGEALLGEDVPRTGYGAECPEGMVASRVSPLAATLSDGTQAIAGVVLGCAELSVDGAEQVSVGPEELTAEVHGDFVVGVDPEPEVGACPFPVSVGLHGRTGAWVDTIGAVCAELVLSHMGSAVEDEMEVEDLP